jgi:hypothetical protein
MGDSDRAASASGTTDGDSRIYGWMLTAGSAFAVALAMVHPRLSSHELAAVVREIAAGAALNGTVHGALMVLNLVLVAGFYGLSRRIGPGRPLVACAMTFYAAGALAMLGAAVINGFALGIFASRYAAVPPEQAAAVSASFNLAGSIAATWAGIGAVATSGAIAAWSLALVSRPGAIRIIAGLGILLGAATAAMVVTGTLILDVHGFLLLVVSQAAWTIAIGIQLIRGRL